MKEILDPAVWRGRRVLLTGHTGFKGSWMALLLTRLGARVTGLSLPDVSERSLYRVLSPWPDIESLACDIRDPSALRNAIDKTRPEIVIHMAAQALVSDSYADPVGTIDTNVLGTVHILETLRSFDAVSSILIVTSDKVYENQEAGVNFAETSPLGGHDPYSASKAAAEILTSAYQRSFFSKLGVPVMTARAGNVIGGGDWAANRLIPDLWRAYESGRAVIMRNPGSVRPWQHVLDPLYGYLLYVQRSLKKLDGMASSLNFGPPREPVRTVQQVAEKFAASLGCGEFWTVSCDQNHMHESRFLSIDSTSAYQTLGWRTELSVDEAISWTCDWYTAYQNAQDMRTYTNAQIGAYLDRVQASASDAHDASEPA